MSRKPKIAVVTGTRAEFGLLSGVIDEIRRQETAEVLVFASGMHLEPEFGNTLEEVRAHSPIAGVIPMHPPRDSRAGMAEAVGQGLAGFSNAFEGAELSGVLVLGDRTEAFAATLAATYLDIPLAHVHGGDVSGNPIDDFQRDSISRCAQLHLAATPKSAERLRALPVTGQLEIVGAPGLDALRQRPERSSDRLRQELGLRDEPWIVVLFHPNPRDAERSHQDMTTVLDGARRVADHRQSQLVLIGSNNDAGSQGVRDAVAQFREQHDVTCFSHLSRDHFLDLLAHAELLVGNSSSGVIETGLLGVRVIDVGDRQQGRERDGNVVEASVNADAIVAAASRSFSDRQVKQAVAARTSVYGDGNACSRIARLLPRLWETALNESSQPQHSEPVENSL